MLRPQDVMTLGWIVLQRGNPWRYADLAQQLGLSASESHGSVSRLIESGLMHPGLMGKPPRVNTKAALDFLVRGVPYAFYPKRGAMTRGMPTSVAAPPLNRKFQLGEEVPVWPDAEGEARGYALQPLYRSAPVAARNNPEMYEFLALVDALRDGRVREKEAARKQLEVMFSEK